MKQLLFMALLLMPVRTLAESSNNFPSDKIGIVAGACMAIENHKLTKGEDISIIGQGSDKFELGRAQITGNCKVKERERVEQSLAGSHGKFSYYKFSPEVTSGLVALVKPLKIKHSQFHTTIDLGKGDNTEAEFRVCSSQEGLHLTLWIGEQSQRKRFWHSYYYLGYDLEPDCTDAEAKNE